MPCSNQNVQPNSLPDLQNEHALCHKWVVVQVCFWREHQQVRQQVIHVHIKAAAAAAAVLQLCQHLLHSGLEQVHSSMARVLHCRLQLLLALLLRGLQPCRCILQAHRGNSNMRQHTA